MTSPTAEERARAVLQEHGIEVFGGSMAFRANINTGDAILAAMLAFEDAAIERAANTCLQVGGLIGASAGSSIDSALREAAQSIRALAGGEEG